MRHYAQQVDMGGRVVGVLGEPGTAVLESFIDTRPFGPCTIRIRGVGKRAIRLQIGCLIGRIVCQGSPQAAADVSKGVVTGDLKCNKAIVPCVFMSTLAKGVPWSHSNRCQSYSTSHRTNRTRAQHYPIRRQG